MYDVTIENLSILDSNFCSKNKLMRQFHFQNAKKLSHMPKNNDNEKEKSKVKNFLHMSFD